MSAGTTIEWTDATFNPWWGCEKISPGCANCYAAAFDHRLGRSDWGADAPRRFFGDAHWNEPLKWERAAAKSGSPFRVFCASMADVFEDRRDLDPHRHRLWRLIEATPHLTWQLLTKRPENADKLTPGGWVLNGWPSNVWAGVTAEDQARAALRVPRLHRIPARVKFVSYEPALERIDFSDSPSDPESTMAPWSMLDGIDWLIIGAESGRKARPFSQEWARSARDQCAASGTAFFYKQDAIKGLAVPTPELDGRRHVEFPE